MTALTVVPPIHVDPQQEVLLVVYLPDGPRTFVIANRLTVGRGATSGVPIASTSVSRDHAVITRDPSGTLTVVDEGSTNGTWVNGERIAPHVPVVLDLHSALRFGAVHCELRADIGRGVDTDPPIPIVGADAAGMMEEHTTVGRGSALMRVARNEPDKKTGAGDLVARDPRMKEIVARIAMIASSGLSVLVYGETGVGKERIAEHLHKLSPRASEPFVKINCAAIPENIFESGLFGYERGAFTGANTPKPGLLEAADRGTLFLDEVGEMPLSAQAKLLRVLETREVTRLGAVKPKRVNVRIVSATNRDLKSAIRSGVFRADLFYRLQGLHLFIPPLRERPLDLAQLVELFVEDAARRQERPTPAIAADTMKLLLEHPWPGNVRELRNVLERSVVLAQGETLTPDCVSLDYEDEPVGPASSEGTGSPFPGPLPVGDPDTKSFARPPMPPAGLPLSPDGQKAALEAQMQEVEKARVQQALNEAGGNQTRAARILGISRGTLIARIEAFGLARPRKNKTDP